MKFSIALVAAVALAQNCQKITLRKEVNDLSQAEWKMITDTIAEAQKRRDPNSRSGLSIWEEAANAHNALNSQIHWTCVFFPWHRYFKFIRLFLVDMERKLQAINPDFFFPYWDSAAEWNNADNSVVFRHLGGNTSPVTNDIFQGQRLRGHDGTALKRGGRTLSRALVSRETFNVEYQRSLRTGFEGWSRALEALHGYLHVEVGGTRGQMGEMYSPLDPIFYLHHGHFDYLWSQAQAGWMANRLALESQFQGLDAARRRCSASTMMPGYNNDFNSVIELNNLCVRYLNKGEVVPQPPASTSARITSTVVASSTAAPSSVAPSSSAVRTTAAPSSSAIPSSVAPSSSVAPTTAIPSVVPTTAVPSVAPTSAIPSVAPTSAVPSVVPTTAIPSAAPTTIVPTVGPSGVAPSSAAPSSAVPTVGPSGVAPSGVQTSNVNTITVNPTNTATTAIPVPTESYDYTKDYTPLDTCFRPLPEEWIKMQEKGSAGAAESIREVQQRLLDSCQQTVEKIKNGVVIPPMPIYNPEEKPMVVAPAPKPVEIKPDYTVLSGGTKHYVASTILGMVFLLL